MGDELQLMQYGEMPHVFQKKSTSGIKTPPSDKDLIRKRYNAAVSAAKEEDKNERRN